MKFTQNATVKEALRVGMAVPGRLPRVVPDSLTGPFMVDGKVVPPGTTVSMSTYTMHTGTSIWARMPANSDLTGGSVLRAKVWISTSVPFQRAQGCALAKSEYQRHLISTKEIY